MWRMEALAREGITAATVGRAVAAGEVERVTRGIYRSARAAIGEGADLATASARAPRSVVCLLSAAALHGLGDVVPDEVWLAIPGRDRTPGLGWPRIRAVRWSAPEALSLGVEGVVRNGVPVRVTGRARTVADMLRMRAAVGEDRALEVLRDYTAAGGSLPEVRSLAERLGAGKAVGLYLNAFGYMGGVP